MEDGLSKRERTKDSDETRVPVKEKRRAGSSQTLSLDCEPDDELFSHSTGTTEK